MARGYRRKFAGSTQTDVFGLVARRREQKAEPEVVGGRDLPPGSTDRFVCQCSKIRSGFRGSGNCARLVDRQRQVMQTTRAIAEPPCKVRRAGPVQRGEQAEDERTSPGEVHEAVARSGSLLQDRAAEKAAEERGGGLEIGDRMGHPVERGRADRPGPVREPADSRREIGRAEGCPSSTGASASWTTMPDACLGWRNASIHRGSLVSTLIGSSPKRSLSSSAAANSGP